MNDLTEAALTNALEEIASGPPIAIRPTHATLTRFKERTYILRPTRAAFHVAYAFGRIIPTKVLVEHDGKVLAAFEVGA